MAFIYYLLLSEVGINLQKGGYEERYQAACHDNDEEHLVTYKVLYVSRHHAGEHQSEVRDACANRVMRRAELALTVVKHVKREDGESESVAKLLNEEAG